MKDLKGKKVGVSSLGSGPDSLLRDLLRKHGWRKAGKSSFCRWARVSLAFMLYRRGISRCRHAFNTCQFHGSRGRIPWADFLYRSRVVELQGSVVVTEQLLASDFAQVERFVRATLKGFLFFRDQRSETISILARFLRMREDAAAKIYDVVRPGMTADGTVGEELQRRSFEHVVGRLALKEPPRLEKIFDYFLAVKIRQELRSSGWKP